MLLRFGVSNHLSIRDFQELSFVASSLKDRDEGLIPCAAAPKGAVVPAAVIYGANASGKSNLMTAMGIMLIMVRDSHRHGRPGGGVLRQPFALDPACAGKPSRFEIDFVVDGVRHHYGFETSDDAFESEWLYDFPASRRRMLFERESGEFRFGRGLKGRNAVIADLTRPNSLYLSAAAQNGHERLSQVSGYFRSVHGVYATALSGVMVSVHLAEKETDDRAIDFLGKIGTGVVGYRRKEIEYADEIEAVQRDVLTAIKKRVDVPADLEATISGDWRTAIELAHLGRDGEQVYLGLDLESAGTRRLLFVLGFAFRALDEGTPLFVDELDASLHTQAAEAVLRLFCSRKTNPKGAQLVATTHDTNLMRAPLLRRDQLWFTEKDVGGATRLYPLTDIRTRKGDDIGKGYLQGRYGAVPFDDPVSDLAPPR